MATVEESLGGASSLAAGLRQGERTIDSNQTITFYLYARLVLPVDGFVFWVAAPMVTQGALAKAAAFNTSAFNTAPFNESGALGVADNTLVARGSLHYATEMEQTEEANYAVNRVVFTSEQPIQALNRVGPNTMFIATIDGIRFAFSSRSSFFRQAGLWHYVGNAIYSTMESQIIDTPEDFNGKQIVVSNSLPAWLAINTYAPVYPVLLPFPAIPLYPSFAVPQNLRPPYGSIHIGEENTNVRQGAPYIGGSGSHRQLMDDIVRITIFGANNDAAMAFQDAAIAYATDTELFGITNIPFMRDVKATQNELLTLAMKKRITFETSYYQSSVRNIARQMINQCLVTGDNLFVIPDYQQEIKQYGSV
jgi:hypothetical protein